VRASTARRAARRRHRGRAARPRGHLPRAALMKPVARLALTLVAAFPVQRALLAVVALVSVIAVGIALVAGGQPSVQRLLAAGFVVATLFSAFVTFPCFMACGAVFAALSAPRTFLLLPHFRRRLLAAVHITFVVGITPVV